MTDLEDRLRRDLRRLAARAEPGSIRPLGVPPARKRSRLVRWLAPAAAAATVLIVVAGFALIGPQAGLRAGGQPAAIPGLTGPMPPYYVTVFQRYTGPRGGRVTTTAAVHDSATGAQLSSVAVPALLGAGTAPGPMISAAADDRTFVITELIQNGQHNISRFFLLHVADQGRSASLTRLPITVPASLAIDDVALSPDGSRLAISLQSCSGNNCQYSGIRVVTLASGEVSTWTTRANGAPFNVSWADDTQVAFFWQSDSRTPARVDLTGYRLLTLSGGGRDLLGGSTAIASSAAEPSGYVPAALVALNGNVVITSTARNYHQWYGRDTVVGEFLELSARSGKLLGVLYTSTQKFVSPGINGAGILDQECNVVSLASSGVHVLVQCFGMGFGRLDGSRFTPLAGFPSATSSGISGQDSAAW
jgi:hypothetical protein